MEHLIDEIKEPLTCASLKRMTPTHGWVKSSYDFKNFVQYICIKIYKSDSNSYVAVPLKNVHN